MRLWGCFGTSGTMQRLSAATCIRPSTKAARIARLIYLSEIEGLQRYLVVR
jgi:hypothetical protein